MTDARDGRFRLTGETGFTAEEGDQMAELLNRLVIDAGVDVVRAEVRGAHGGNPDIVESFDRRVRAFLVLLYQAMKRTQYRNSKPNAVPKPTSGKARKSIPQPGPDDQVPCPKCQGGTFFPCEACSDGWVTYRKSLELL